MDGPNQRGGCQLAVLKGHGMSNCNSLTSNLKLYSSRIVGYKIKEIGC